MKKQLSIALAALVLVACGGGSSDNNLNNNLTGYWSGTVTGVANNGSLNITMTLAQSDGVAGNGVTSIKDIPVDITGIYTTSSGSGGSVSGKFDGSSFTGNLSPSVSNNCSAKIVLFFSYNSLNGTALTDNCGMSASAKAAFTKQ
jgi:hypothetical protein